LTQVSRLLSTYVNVWGIQADEDKDEEILNYSLKHVAADYIKKMRVI